MLGNLPLSSWHLPTTYVWHFKSFLVISDYPLRDIWAVDMRHLNCLCVPVYVQRQSERCLCDSASVCEIFPPLWSVQDGTGRPVAVAVMRLWCDVHLCLICPNIWQPVSDNTLLVQGDHGFETLLLYCLCFMIIFWHPGWRAGNGAKKWQSSGEMCVSVRTVTPLCGISQGSDQTPAYVGRCLGRL